MGSSRTTDTEGHRLMLWAHRNPERIAKGVLFHQYKSDCALNLCYLRCCSPYLRPMTL